MNGQQHTNKRIAIFVIIGLVALMAMTLMAFLYLSDAFRKAPVREIFPDNTYAETLHVVTDIDYEPFSYADETGAYLGLDVELISEIANRLEMNLDLALLEWTGANDLFFSGQADAFLNMEADLIATDDRMIPTLPTAEKQYVVYGRETVASVAELYGRRVASLHRLPELGLSNITYFDSYAEIFEALGSGAFDFGICPIQVGNVFLEKMQLTDIRPSYAVSHIYGEIALAAGNEELKERMDAVISDLKKEGFLDRLDRKWISNRYQSMTLSGMVRAHPMVGAGFLAGLLLLVGLVFFSLMQSRRNEELELARRKAEESNLAKGAFLSNMSHEIRTPINAVLGMNEMILREANTRTPSKEGYTQIASYAANVESAGKNLLSIINDILDFSKIDAGKMEIVEAEYKMSSVLNDLSNIAMYRARDKGLDFRVDVDAALPDALFGDEVRLRQILTNVLGNAVKYTKQGSVTLTVGGEKTGEDTILLQCVVKDTGVGIKEEDLGRLFDKFERMDLAGNRTIEGTGLGLAITKSLLTLMNGDITVNSIYGEGSVFTVTIPQKVVSREAIGDFKAKFLETMQAQPLYHESLHAPHAKVLVVDDTEMNLTVVEGLLEQTQVQLDTALSGAQALEKTLATSYDLIFMDQMMPHMDGAETLHHIRAQAEGKNRETPVICLTADAVNGAKEKYLSQGFTDYLSKPVAGEALEQAMKRYLPSEKVTLQTVAVSEDAEDSQENTDTPSALFLFYRTVPALDYAEAIRLCSSEKVLQKTLLQFYRSADENADAIAQFLAKEAYHDYTIKVHALKSSARLIGADALSELARHLEECGNAGTEESISELNDKTPVLLTNYRELKQQLAAYVAEEDSDPARKPLFSDEQWEEMIRGLREAIESFDSDATDLILENAGKYRMPQDKADLFSRITSCANAMDWDGLEQMLP